MIYQDMEAAGIDYTNNGSGKLDFHSLRHTIGTLLANSGVHPKTAQSIMRHSDINLTMNRCTHSYMGQLSQAVESLPDFTSPSIELQKKTGTENMLAQKIGWKSGAVNGAKSGETQRISADRCKMSVQKKSLTSLWSTRL